VADRRASLATQNAARIPSVHSIGVLSLGLPLSASMSSLWSQAALGMNLQ